MSKIKQLCSYLWDIPIEKSSSVQNAYLEVVWSRGRKMLNTKNANYSFGNGYKVFELAFDNLGDRLNHLNKVLVLGFGCGSVLELLTHKYKLDCELVGVEYDAEIIRLFRTHFNEYSTDKLQIVLDDALHYLENSNESYDLIIIDLFDDLRTAPIVFDPHFNEELIKHCKDGSTLIYNTVKNSLDSNQYTELLIQLSRHFKEVSTQEFENINQIITAFKP